MTAQVYHVRYEKEAQKEIKKLDPYQAKILLVWIADHLEGSENPRVSGKSLVANRKGQWRYRVGNYRIICFIDDEDRTIYVLSIAHRRNVYGN